jgi:tetratricopeptide (TPR) repeat protein
MEDWEGALACYERARALCPCSADTTFYLGLLHLSHGNFALGWEEYEQREEARRLRKAFSEPQWKGEPLEGARIYLHAEQGLGDTLQAVRYVPLVAARGGQVVLAVQQRLHRLLAHTEGAQRVITDGGTVSDLKWQCPLLSLPLAFGTDLNSIPAKVPYVYADPELAEAWRARMPATSLRVGLVWGGDPKYSQNFRRIIPLELLAPLTCLEGTTFYSLQMGPPTEQIKPLGERLRLIDLQNEQKDFADTAAIVANLDLVISIDTSVAHLAGAMAKPVWILLNNSPDWRWLLKREDSPWYPTARLFRQTTLGDWPDVVSRVERELRALAAAKVESRNSKVESGNSKLEGVQRPVGGTPPALAAPAGGHRASKPLSLKPEVRELLKDGIAHQQAGRKKEAEACYRQALEAEPHCPQVLLLLGLLAQQTGRNAESIRLMEQALALNPNDPDTLNSLAESYLAEKQFEAARRCVERVAELLPQSGEAHHRLGKVQERTGEWDAALECYQRAVALEPDSPAIHSSLGRLYEKQDACAEAVECCRRAAVLDPANSDIYTQLGTALTGLKKYAEAVEALRRALDLQPGNTRAVYALGYLFEQKGDFASAVESYQAALNLSPDMEPARLHLGIVYSQQGELTQAIQCFERVLKLDPDSAEARAFLGLIHLQQGNFRDGLREYEERWRTNHGFRFGRKFRQPGWQGDPLEGSRILLYAEQGMGDTIHFVRYVPEVAARGGKVILEVQARLRRLLAETPGAEQVVRSDEALPEFDWQCPLASLPLVLGTELHTIPAPIPYVHADPEQVEAWRERLRAADRERDGGRPLRIGLVWAGSPSHPYERWRSIPLEQLAPLTHLEGTVFYSLQMGEAAGQLVPLGSQARVIDLQNEQKDFADTAAIVANLDLVISIDTSVAHLAGALGKPVWIPLFRSPDWRWLLEREDSPWYPTARLFRQSKLGEWQDVLARVHTHLRQLVKSSG